MFYIILRVTTNLKTIVDTQKIKRMDSKHATTENDQFTTKVRKRGRKEHGNYKIARNKRWHYLAIITLHVNLFNSPIERHRVTH